MTDAEAVAAAGAGVTEVTEVTGVCVRAAAGVVAGGAAGVVAAGVDR